MRVSRRGPRVLVLSKEVPTTTPATRARVRIYSHRRRRRALALLFYNPLSDRQGRRR